MNSSLSAVEQLDSLLDLSPPNSEGVLSYRHRVILDFISYVFLSSFFCVLGIVTNTINIIIFYKQGLDSTMNISFFSLAISDLISLITLQWMNICINPLMMNADLPFFSGEVQYLTAAWPHACFGHITCWITAYMTAERCLCIAMPLKVKQIATPRRTTLIICFIYFINVATLIPEYVFVYFDWRVIPQRNQSRLGLAFRENRQTLEGISYILGATLGVVSFPVVIVFTLILAVKLRQQADWRMKTSNIEKTKNISNRDIKTTNMVVFIATILIVCYGPGIAASLVTFSVPEFSVVGKDMNLYYSLWGFLFMLGAVNSSINIFLYYRMSTKFRNSFNELFGRCPESTELPDKEEQP